jgi:hypothetical protein
MGVILKPDPGEATAYFCGGEWGAEAELRERCYDTFLQHRRVCARRERTNDRGPSVGLPREAKVVTSKPQPGGGGRGGGTDFRARPARRRIR